jgi:hypothetical protein
VVPRWLWNGDELLWQQKIIFLCSSKHHHNQQVYCMQRKEKGKNATTTQKDKNFFPKHNYQMFQPQQQHLQTRKMPPNSYWAAHCSVLPNMPKLLSAIVAAPATNHNHFFKAKKAHQNNTQIH